MSYDWNWNFFLEAAPYGETIYLGWVVSGLIMTISVSLTAWALALAIGTLIGVLRTSHVFSLSKYISVVYIELFRNIPLLVQLFIWYYVMPEFLPSPIGDNYKQMDPVTQQFLTGALCLGLFTAARVANHVRVGIETLSKDQANAGLTLGLTLTQTYQYVLLPQTFRTMLPTLTSEFVSIVKNSSVCSTVGLLELSAQGRQLVDYTAHPYESFIIITLCYVFFNLPVIIYMNRVGRSLNTSGIMG